MFFTNFLDWRKALIGQEYANEGCSNVLGTYLKNSHGKHWENTKNRPVLTESLSILYSTCIRDVVCFQ